VTEANNKDYRVGNDAFWARAWVSPLVLAVVGGLLAVVTAGPDRLGYAYLFALFTVVTFMLGGLFLVLIQFLTASHWGVSSRRIAEVIMSGAPVVALLALSQVEPVGGGLGHQLLEPGPGLFAEHAAGLQEGRGSLAAIAICQVCQPVLQ